MFLCWGYRAFVWCARLSFKESVMTLPLCVSQNFHCSRRDLWLTPWCLNDTSWGDYSSNDHFPSDVRTLSLRLIPLNGHFASDQTLITSQPVFGDSIPQTPLTVRWGQHPQTYPTELQRIAIWGHYPSSSRALPPWLTLLWGHHPSV